MSLKTHLIYMRTTASIAIIIIIISSSSSSKNPGRLKLEEIRLKHRRSHERTSISGAASFDLNVSNSNRGEKNRLPYHVLVHFKSYNIYLYSRIRWAIFYYFITILLYNILI